MANFCIPKTYSAVLQQALKNGTLTADKLYSMTAEERKAAFAQHIPDATVSQEVSSRFESEMVERQKRGIASWIKSQTEGADAAQKTADSLGNIGVIKPSDISTVLKGVVESRHGVALTGDQLKLINSKVDAVDTAVKESNGRKTGAFFEAKKDLQDTINSFRDPNFSRTVSRVGMANILTSTTSIIRSWTGGKLYELLGKAGRRIRSGQITGLVTDLAARDASEALQTYKKTGYNAAMTIGSDVLAGESRKTGNAYTDLVLQKLHGSPHARTFINSYFDEANLSASRLAYNEVGKSLTAGEEAAYAEKVYRDATSMSPQTDAGKVVHAQATANAAYWSNLNDSKTSQFTGSLRKTLEKLPGGENWARLIMPMVKVGANVAEKGADFAGGSVFKSFTETKALTTALEATKQVLQGATSAEEYDQILNGTKWKKAVLATAGTGSAYLMGAMLVQAIGPENYQGVPISAAENQEMNERGAKPNSVRIGGRWFSLSLLPGIGALMAGEFAAAQTKGGALEKLGAGGENVLTTLVNEVPGFSNLTTYAEDLVGGYGVGNKVSNATSDLVSDIYGRVVPSVFSQAGKAADHYQRQVPKGMFGYTESQIPGLRENLPIKRNETGQPLTQNPLATFLGGSYTSSDINTPVTVELDRLVKKGYPTTIEEPQNNAEFKALLSEKGQDVYKQATEDYYAKLNTRLDQLFSSDAYTNAPVSSSVTGKANKKKLIADVASTVRKEVLQTYGYRKPAGSTSLDF